MKNKYVFDSSFLSSLFYETDINHEKAIKVFSELPSGSLFLIPATVYIEMLVGLKRFPWFRDEKFYQFISSINVEFVFIDNKFLRRYERFLNKRIAKLKAIDSTVLFTARENQAGILTFDKKLQKYSNQKYKI